MKDAGQSIGKPRHSAGPHDVSSNLAHSNPGGGASWLRSALCATVIAGTLVSCGDDSQPGGGPVETTQCNDNLPSDTLSEFAQKCSEAIGVDVPAFNCDDGTLVPQNNLTGTYPDQFCDAPSVLLDQCDPGSRFHVLAQTNEAAIVAVCRKQGNADGFYGDIAVIQYNRINGATCFYQGALGTLPAQVTAPSAGNDPVQGDFPWMDPADTAEINCVGCHDNGPFIRSPYLAQLRNEPMNRLPGTNEGSGAWDQPTTWNKTLPYKFVGNDFQTWKVYSVSLQGTGSGCIQCHRLGISSSHGTFPSAPSAFGTAQALGLTATATQQAHKNPHSDTAPIWMKPGQIDYDQAAANQAFAAAVCAASLAKRGNNDPNAFPLPQGCSAVEYGQGNTCTSVVRR